MTFLDLFHSLWSSGMKQLLCQMHKILKITLCKGETDEPTMAVAGNHSTPVIDI